MHPAYVGKIREGKTAEYTCVHEKVWPELIDAMRRAGVERESCFVFGRQIFVYVEAPDLDLTMKNLAEDPISQEWERSMELLLERPQEDNPELFLQMAEVFCMRRIASSPP
jgi:L-rhamnose mutarotase